jgi:hypothetical protein
VVAARLAFSLPRDSSDLAGRSGDWSPCRTRPVRADPRRAECPRHAEDSLHLLVPAGEVAIPHRGVRRDCAPRTSDVCGRRIETGVLRSASRTTIVLSGLVAVWAGMRWQTIRQLDAGPPEPEFEEESEERILTLEVWDSRFES